MSFATFRVVAAPSIWLEAMASSHDGRNKIGILVLRRNQVLTCQTATDIHVEIVQQLKYLIRHHKAETVLAEMQGGSVQLPEVFERMPQLFPAQSAFCTNVFTLSQYG